MMRETNGLASRRLVQKAPIGPPLNHFGPLLAPGSFPPDKQSS